MVAHQAAGGLIGTGGILRAKGEAWPHVGRAGAAEVDRMIVKGVGMKSRQTKKPLRRTIAATPLPLKNDAYMRALCESRESLSNCYAAWA